MSQPKSTLINFQKQLLSRGRYGKVCGIILGNTFKNYKKLIMINLKIKGINNNLFKPTIKIFIIF